MKTAVVRAFGLFVSVLVAGVASAQSTQAVEWKVSDGGNGHWYEVLNVGPLDWFAARSRCDAIGGYPATITHASEHNFIAGLIEAAPNHGEPTVGRRWGPWLGGYQDRHAPDYQEPFGGWRWVTGESWSYQEWGPFDPNGFNWCVESRLQEDFLFWCGDYGRCSYWGDLPPGGCDGNPPEYVVVEWSADCNSDGIVDYGQIQRGELIDLNGNGVPDICETSVSSVIPPSVPSQGGSTITIRGNGFQANPTVRIGGVPATNIVRVSLTEIAATSPALLPGMTSIQVNDFTLQDAIYIRPECGSDLDQNGIVDAGDISIILLDFGSCYETPFAAPTPDVPPLLDAQSAPETSRRR